MLFLLMALVLLFFLLQLNQWLPGVWSGGGGSGFLETKQPQTDFAHTDAPERNTPLERDPTEAETPKDAPGMMPPPGGVEVEVRTAAGDMGSDWQVTTGSRGGSLHTPDIRGRARLSSLAGGLGVRNKGHFLRHGQVGQIPVQRLSFRLPPTKLGLTRGPRARTIRVVDADTGDAIGGVPIAIDAALEAKEQFQPVGKTGNDGTLLVPAQSDLVRIRVGPPTNEPSDAARVVTQMMTLRVHEPWIVRLPRAGAGPLTIEKGDEVGTVTWELALKEAQGPWRVVARGTENEVDAYMGNVPRGDVTALLRARVKREGDTSYMLEKAVSRLPATVAIAKPRSARVTVVDSEASPVANATVRVSVHTRAEEEGVKPLTSTARSDARGEAVLPVLGSGRVTILVLARGASPSFVPEANLDEPQTVAISKGEPFSVQVKGKGGGAIPRAHVSLHLSNRGERITVRSLTSEDGQARWPSLPSGPVEVEVDAPGYATSLHASDRALSTPLEVAMTRGYPLYIAVNDPYGVPLAGVHVDVSAAKGGRPILLKRATTADSLFGDEPRTSTDSMGWFVARDVVDQPMTLRLSKEGFAAQTIEGVRPGAVAHFVTLVPKRN